MTIVRMMQVSIHQVIDVIPVWNGRVSAVGTVNMSFRISLRSMCATVRMRLIHLDFVFDDVVSLQMFQMALSQIIDMAVVFDRGMSATGTVLMELMLVF
jgi:hypothetical protein